MHNITGIKLMHTELGALCSHHGEDRLHQTLRLDEEGEEVTIDRWLLDQRVIFWPLIVWLSVQN